METETKVRRVTRHSDEFKLEALKLSESVGIAEAARRLGISSSLFYTWRDKFEKKMAPTKHDDESLMAENVRLSKLVREQKEEILILKKAAAYFAQSLI